MTEEEVKRIAEEAAEKAVEAVLAKFGITSDVSDAKEVREMQADMLHLRKWRLTTEAVQRQGFITITIAFVTGLIGLVVVAMQRGSH